MRVYDLQRGKGTEGEGRSCLHNGDSKIIVGYPEEISIQVPYETVEERLMYWGSEFQKMEDAQDKSWRRLWEDQSLCDGKLLGNSSDM